jgi:hypothetical protein
MTATTTATGTTAQFKAAILELIEENDPQLEQWLKAALSNHLPKPKKNLPKPTPSSSTLPFWKAHPEISPLTPSEGGILRKEKLEKLQQLFGDAPSAEEIISYLTK